MRKSPNLVAAEFILHTPLATTQHIKEAQSHSRRINSAVTRLGPDDVMVGGMAGMQNSFCGYEIGDHHHEGQWSDHWTDHQTGHWS